MSNGGHGQRNGILGHSPDQCLQFLTLPVRQDGLTFCIGADGHITRCKQENSIFTIEEKVNAVPIHKDEEIIIERKRKREMSAISIKKPKKRPSMRKMKVIEKKEKKLTKKIMKADSSLSTGSKLEEKAKRILQNSKEKLKELHKRAKIINDYIADVKNTQDDNKRRKEEESATKSPEEFEKPANVIEPMDIDIERQHIPMKIRKACRVLKMTVVKNIILLEKLRACITYKKTILLTSANCRGNCTIDAENTKVNGKLTKQTNTHKSRSRLNFLQ